MKRKRLVVALITLLLMFTALFVYRYANYRNNIYYYDTQVDYDYEFKESNLIILDYLDNSVTIPEDIGEGFTAFLKVTVQATFKGKWSTPSVEISNGDKSVLEYFEDGAKGFRYLNISNLLTEGETRLNFSANSLRINNQDAELIYFKNEPLDDKRILVIGTHPDDAEIAAYGIYSQYSNVFVLNIKSGESGPFKYDEVYTDSILHYRKKGQLRTWNSISVPLLGGVHHDSILNFAYYSNLEKMYKKKSQEFPATFTKATDINVYRKQNFSFLKDSITGSSNWEDMVKNLQIIVSHVKPDVIVTPYPALDAHKEHQYTTIALMEALKADSISEGELYLYSNHYIINEHYPYGNSGGTMPLPPNFSNAIYFKRIYSHPLGLNRQKDKLFALEAMHDLRPDTEWRFGEQALRKAFQTAKTEMFNGDNSYFKRALRSNELFFVVPIADIYDADVVEKLITEIPDPAW
ncbi:PIG-L family deacetylase [Muricauda sp. 2012CJ35-5]|uniref:PIG-L family deacetylase n=1 Tax=Flagellimonas spongiicola TaxID=2942208 RepID=A0ABT0PVZ3_9FLAO|nr:PIG-L family deacetylase [Allomuricauda spongiicola]MCL6275549.1 PIG-L family deacetylase [Allomuricauda spongiicola]